MTTIPAPPKTLSQVGRAAQDLGLAGLLGGTLFGRMALHPAVASISDPRERGEVVNAAWRRYGTVNSLALGAGRGGGLGGGGGGCGGAGGAGGPLWARARGGPLGGVGGGGGGVVRGGGGGGVGGGVSGGRAWGGGVAPDRVEVRARVVV